MKGLSFQRFRKHASSLIVTLLVLVVLSTIVVAFMQSMSVERMTAKISRNSYRAKLAAEAGLETAMRQIALGVNTNQAYVVGQTNDAANFGPVLVIGQTNLTNLPQMMPLISGDFPSLNGYPTVSSNAVTAYINARTNTSSSNSINVNLRNALIEVTSDTNKYRAPWTYLTNSDGVTNSRYAYIVLDEFARVNPRYHGDTNLSRSNATNWFPGSGVLPLFTGETNLLTSSEATAVRAIGTNTNPSPLTPVTVGQAFATRAVYEAKKHLLTLNDTWSPDVIPADLPEGGKPKYNINNLATNTAYGANSELRANNIADIINTNLITFRTRDQSLSGTNQLKYLRRLGACIIDYIDSDSDITTVNGGEPAGRDLFPLVTAIAHRLQLTSLVTSAPASAALDSQFFVQVWNPYTIPIIVTNARLVIQNQIQPTFGTALKLPISTYDKTNTTAVTVSPNEMVVLTFPTGANSWTGSSPTATTGVSWPSSADTADGSWPYFSFYINGQLVDQNRRAPTDTTAVSGLPYASKNMTDLNTHWECFFVPTQSGSAPWRFVGDPRSNFLSSYDWAVISSDTSYVNSTRWKGRQQPTTPRWQEFQTSWLSRDYVRANPPSGAAPANVNALPSSVTTAYTTNDAANAVSIIRNAPMQSIGELGNIYDEAQANDDLLAPTGGSPSSPFVSAGGRTLRIGQPEFASSTASVSWNTNGKRAVELLDLFTVNITNSASTNFPAIRGRVNVNTASQAVLEAIFYNIAINSDAAYPNSALTNIPALAQSLITNRPYNKLSDLYKITPNLINSTNFSPVLGANLATTSANPNPQAPVFDRAREEPFGKLVELCTVQSRSFRIYIVGQSLGPNLKRQGQVVIEASLQIRSDANGKLTPMISYERVEN